MADYIKGGVVKNEAASPPANAGKSPKKSGGGCVTCKKKLEYKMIPASEAKTEDPSAPLQGGVTSTTLTGGVKKSQRAPRSRRLAGRVRGGNRRPVYRRLTPRKAPLNNPPAKPPAKPPPKPPLKLYGGLERDRFIFHGAGNGRGGLFNVDIEGWGENAYNPEGDKYFSPDSLDFSLIHLDIPKPRHNPRTPTPYLFGGADILWSHFDRDLHWEIGPDGTQTSVNVGGGLGRANMGGGLSNPKDGDKPIFEGGVDARVMSGSVGGKFNNGTFSTPDGSARGFDGGFAGGLEPAGMGVNAATNQPAGNLHGGLQTNFGPNVGLQGSNYTSPGGHTFGGGAQVPAGGFGFSHTGGPGGAAATEGMLMGPAFQANLGGSVPGKP